MGMGMGMDNHARLSASLGGDENIQRITFSQIYLIHLTN